MAADLITEDDIKLALDGSADTLRELAGDDGTGAPRADRIAYGIGVASEDAYGILLAGFGTVEKVQALAANDPSVRHAVAMIFREKLAEGKKDFRLPDGTCSFAPDARRARDLLREKSRGAQRTSAEETTNGPGRSSLLRPRSANAIPSRMLDSTTGRPRGF